MPIPTPKRASGIFVGSKLSDVQIDIFIDIQCPHSKLAWANIFQLISAYENDNFGLKLHMITLSNHRQSWDISKAIFAYSDDSDKQVKLIDYFYQRQSEFLNGEFLNKTHQQLFEYIQTSIKAFDSTCDVDDILSRLDSSNIYEQARTPNRYAAVRSVWGTPTFFINNARQSKLNHASTKEDWLAFIETLKS